MATFTSDAVAGNMAFKPHPQGNLGVRTATYSLGAALAGADIVQMCDVFAGETVSQGGSARSAHRIWLSRHSNHYWPWHRHLSDG